MTEHDPVELGELEREILELVWERGQVTADTVREALARSPKESTVRTVLLRLEKKGYLAHDVDGRTFIYRPIQSRETVAARAVKRIAEWFCSGSMKDLMVGMVDAKALDRKEVEELRQRLEQAARTARETKR